MVVDFTKSPEGVKEYQKLDMQYPDHLQDVLYENWLNETNADNLLKYTHHREKEIQSIHIRLVQEEPGQKPLAYLQYDFMHRRLDPACNVTHRYIARCGLFPIPRPHYKITQMSFGKEERKVDYIESVSTGYSIKATKANLQKILSSIGVRKEPPVALGVVAPNGISISIQNIDDFMEGISEPETLQHFGYWPTAEEREKWLKEQGGKRADQQRLSTIARKRAEGNLPERPITASQVQEMLRQQEQQQQQQKEA